MESVDDQQGGLVTARQRSQRGFTLVEVLVVVTISAVVLLPFLAWASLSIRQQEDSRRTNTESFGLGLANVYFPRDVVNSKTAVSSTLPNGVARPDGDIRDCVGGDGSGGQVRLALITSSNQRIVYSLVDSTDQPGTKELWRRSCPNLSSPSDLSLNDVLLNAPSSVAPGQIDPSTDGNNGSAKRLATRISAIDTSCPAADGDAQDPLCTQVVMRAQFPDTPRPAVLQATRRVNNYAPPGTQPIARFTITPNPGFRNQVVDFNASTSFDPRGGALQYRWNFGDPSTTGGCGAVVSNNVPTASCSFTTLGAKTVRLQVVNPEGVISETAIETFQVVSTPPSITFNGQPFTATRQSPRSYSIQFAAGEGTLTSFTVDWGDGTTPLTSSACSGQTTCTQNLSKTYDVAGISRMRVTVNNSTGNSATSVATVSVSSEVLFVAQSNGVDDPECGTVALPCRQIRYALDVVAPAKNKTQLFVAQGTYDRFNVRGGVNVRGGLTNDFQPGGGATSLIAAQADGRWSSFSATNVSAPTTIEGLTATGPDLNCNPPGSECQPLPAPASAQAQAVVILSSTNITMRNLTVNGGIGPSATGIFIDNSRDIRLENSTVNSGSTRGGSNSAYGIRVLRTNAALEPSSLTVIGGSITAQEGRNALPTTDVASAGSPGCDAGNGGNASGPSSPGNGGGGGCGGSNLGTAGGAGGRGGDFSGSGAAGANGGSAASPFGIGGGGGCGSTFGCGTDAGGGTGGARGAAGTPTGQGSQFPSSYGATWEQTVSLGQNGSRGGHGRGGGGGGGGKSASASGGGGGGGGGGGAGGNGGARGLGGGGSFGIYAINATIVLGVTGDPSSRVTITSSRGGDGATGGPGAAGGNGGHGGTGGGQSCCSAGPGGGGGGGGGGAGGTGGTGGPGGPSATVYHGGVGLVPADLNVTLNRFNTQSSRGNGGAGGAGGVQGNGGAGATFGGNGQFGATGAVGNVGRFGKLCEIWSNQPARSCVL